MIMSQTPVLWLTLRQFVSGRSTRVVALFAATPILFSIVYLLNSGGTTPNEFIAGVFNQFLAPTVIPLATLILATATLGNELSDRTIVYLVAKPISRFRIIIEKFIGTFLVTTLALFVGAAVTWLVVAAGPGSPTTGSLGSMFVAIVVGVAAYGALFLLVSLIITRALLAGIIYILLWESLLARFVPGIRVLSIRHFEESIFVRLLADLNVTMPHPSAIATSFLVMGALVVVAIAFATLRLRTMNLD